MSDGARPALKKQNLPVPLPKSAAVHTRLAHVLPALIAAAGEHAGWRYVEFFTVNIRNSHTRRAYARTCGRFFAWCEDRGLALTTTGRSMSPPI